MLHGRSKGHRLRTHQAELFETLLPRLRLKLDAPCPTNPADLFSGPGERAPDRVELEIGFGGGEHLAFRAAEEPDTGFIGCEPFINGVAKLLTEIESRDLRNVRVHDDDARMVLDWLPLSCLDRVWLLYPDPWPKRRQQKRRFISPENLDDLARVMKPGTELRFATDIDDYAKWGLARIAAHSEFKWINSGADEWRTPWMPWPGTRYEAKAAIAGRIPQYLTFQRV